MPRVDPHELLTDREKYPDDMEITLSNGDTISVSEYRDRAMPKGDFTRAAQQWRQRESELQQGYDYSQRQLAQAMQEKAELEAARGQAPAPSLSGGVSPEDLEADPILGPMYRDMKAAQQRLDAHERRMAQHETTFMRDRFMATIGDLKKTDPDLNVDEFLSYSQKNPVIDVEHQTVDLGRTYKLYAHDRLLKDAEKRGEDRGVERGRKAANVPAVPFGRRRTPTKPDGLPSSFQELTDETIMSDPEMQEAASGGDQAA